MMDAPGLEKSRHLRALRALARINVLSLAAPRVWTQLRKLQSPPGTTLRVLDVACGGGEVALAIKAKALEAGLAVSVEGCDISPVAVEFAMERAAKRGLEVGFFQHDVLGMPFPPGFDLVFSSLFLHHLSDHEVVDFLKKVAGATRNLFFQDLCRSHLGYLLALASVRTLTRSSVVRVDGPLSVRAAFSPPEVEEFARQAGLHRARVDRCWPERLTLSWAAV